MIVHLLYFESIHKDLAATFRIFIFRFVFFFLRQFLLRSSLSLNTINEAMTWSDLYDFISSKEIRHLAQQRNLSFRL
jgi:hypothetical protein